MSDEYTAPMPDGYRAEDLAGVIPFPIEIPPGSVVSGVVVAVRLEHPEKTGHGVVTAVNGLEPLEAIGLLEGAKLKIYYETRADDGDEN